MKTHLKPIAWVALVGLLDALYLTIGRVRGEQLVCFTGNGCDQVQNSAYSVLFGLIPIAYLGVGYYIGVIAVALAALQAKQPQRHVHLLLLAGAAGTLFTLYLIGLQAFIIGAWCSWCLLSSVCVLGISLLSIQLWRTAKIKTTPSTQHKHQKGRAMKQQGHSRFYTLYFATAGISIICLSLASLTGQDDTETTTISANRSAQPTQFASYQVKGSSSASVTVYEFSDFQCPACAWFGSEGMNTLLKPYIDRGEVQLVFHDFPLISLHENAIPAAVATRAAGEQGKFWEMHDLLFQNQTLWAKAKEPNPVFIMYAKQLGLDMNRYTRTLQSTNPRLQVENAYVEAVNLQVEFTPAFMVDGEIVNAQELDNAIRKALTDSQ